MGQEYKHAVVSTVRQGQQSQNETLRDTLLSYFFCVYRRKRRCSISKRPHMCQCICYYERTLKQFNAPSARKQRPINTLRVFSLNSCTRRQSSFCFSAIHKHQARLKHDAQSKEAQGVHTTTKLERKDINRPAQTTQTCHASFPLVVSSHRIPLLCCHGRDSRPLPSHTHYQASYSSWHSMSRTMWQLRVTFANSQSCKK